MVRKIVCDEIGWLAPNGDYYPCTNNPDKTHMETAHEIIKDVFGLDPDTLPDSSTYEVRIDTTLGMTGYRSYGFLRSKGYVRVDTETIEPECGLTFEQLVTLSKMVKIHMRGGINHQLIQSILDRNNSSDCYCEEGLLMDKIDPSVPLFDPSSRLGFRKSKGES